MKKESLFWADQIARRVKDRVERDPVLKKIVKENGYIVYDEKTPSGKIHIGSGRGWIIHDVVAKAMRSLGLKARFVLSSDDIDPYDKPNKELPSSFNKYLGMPFMNIPSPVKGYKSFADYYFTQVTDRFKDYGIDADLESTGERYNRGDFNRTIKVALDNNDKIQEIYKRFYGKPLGRLPFNPVCEKCGKIGTTNAYEWDSEREVVKYRCMPDLVKWAKGCKHEGEMSPYDGNGKLPWKVEWAAKWPTVGVVYETAGKDHFTKGGSRDISVAISNEVFKFPPPYPSTEKSMGEGYGFFTVGGKKMSTSKGMGVGFSEMTNYVPAPMLRYMLVRTRPRADVDFDPLSSNDMILLYDKHDRTERIYYGHEKVNERDLDQEKSIYDFSTIGKIPEKMPPQITLTHAATIVQISPDLKGALEILKTTGHVPKGAPKEHQEHVLKRLEFAKRWVGELAEDSYRFQLQDKTKVKPDPDVKKVIGLMVKELEKDLPEKELQDRLYDICRGSDVDIKRFFQTMYNILINKDSGPRLAPFIVAVGRERVKKLLKQVS